MSDADLLREAAALMRERAWAATPGPWWVHRAQPEVVWYGDEALTYRLDEHPDAATNIEWDQWAASTGQLSWGDLREQTDAEHIASWHPNVAVAVAAWLDSHADIHTLRTCDERLTAPCPALAVARAYLGRSPDADR